LSKHIIAKDAELAIAVQMQNEQLAKVRGRKREERRKEGGGERREMEEGEKARNWL
jgi:hypothetical protein